MRGRAGRKGLFPQDTCLLNDVSVTPAELICFTFTLVYVLTSTRSAALRVCSVQLQQYGALQNSFTGLLYVWRMPEHDTAIQMNFAPSRQEVRQRNNITSQKRNKQVLLLIPGPELCSRKYGWIYHEPGRK